MTLLCASWNFISFALVSISGQFWPFIPDNYRFVLLFVILVPFYRSAFVKWSFGALLAFAAFSLHSQLYTAKVNALFQAGENITIIGRVDSIFKQINHGLEYSFIIDSINGQKLNFFVRPTVRLIAPQEKILAPGESWTVPVKIKPVYGRLNDAGFDHERYYASQGLSGKAVVAGEMKRLGGKPSYRFELFQKVDSAIRDFSHQSLIKALSFGVRHDIPPALWKQLQHSGLSHLIAISGLHIGIAFLIGWGIGRIVRLCFPRYLFLPVFLGVTLAFLYAWLAGFSITTQRAFIMCVTISVIELLKIDISRWLKLLITLNILLLIDPMASMSASFWLSFSAVTALVILSQQPVLQAASPVKKLMMVQIMLIGMMIPASLTFFGGFSFFAPFYNLWCVPYFSFIVIPLIFFALSVTPLFPQFSEYLWYGVNLSLEPLIFSLDFSSGGWLMIPQKYTSLSFLVVFILITGVLLSLRQKVVIVAVALTWIFSEKPFKNWRIEMLDVGQGLAILIQSGDRYILYDTGNRWEGGSMAESVVAPVLYQRGIYQLDGLILSHLDSDHAGGKAFIEAEFKPKRKWASQLIPGYLPCVQGEKWRWQQLEFTVLWPPKRVKRAYNPHSCVISISDGITKVLLTGDIEKIAEYILLKNREELKADIMTVPHHGSRSSSTGLFLDAVSPELVLASLAKGNRWGMPSPKVYQRYTEREIEWLDTGDGGQIRITFDEKGWKTEVIRQKQSKTWYRQMLRKGVE